MLHKDLDPKKIPKLTLTPKNLWLFRALMSLSPGVKKAERRGCTTTVEVHEGQRMRVHRPRELSSAACLMWLHGGGLVIGRPKQDDAMCVRFANALGITVVAPRYRLAPRDPFPAALDDCHRAWTTLSAIYPSLVVGGVSAGGGLAACLTQRLKDEGGAMPLAQLLVCPMLDDRTSLHDVGMRAHHVWNQRSNITGWGAYLGEQRGALALPDYAAAARKEDLRGLPATWIGVGTLDLFLDENKAYAERLRAAGVDVALSIVEGGFHGFHALQPRAPVSRAHVDEQIAFLQRAL